MPLKDFEEHLKSNQISYIIDKNLTFEHQKTLIINSSGVRIIFDLDNNLEKICME